MFLVTVTPGTQWGVNDLVDAAKLNLTANPTITVTGGLEDFSNYSSVTPTTKTITVFDLAGDILRAAAGHGASQGQRVKVSNSGGALPAGLSASYEYYLRPDTINPSTDFTLHYSAYGAANNTERVEITGNGTGVQTLTYFAYATGAAFIFDSAGNTWEKGIVSPESLPEFVGATTLVPGTRGAVPAPGPGTASDYLARDGTWKPQTELPNISGINLFTYLSHN